MQHPLQLSMSPNHATTIPIPAPLHVDAFKSWTKDVNDILDKIRINSIILSNEHKKTYFILAGRIKWFRIPVIFLSAIGSIFGIGLGSYMEQKILSAVCSVMSMIVGLIGSLELFLAISHKMENELVQSKELYLLAIEIQKTLLLNIENRNGDGTTYLEDKFNVYSKLIEKSYLLECKIMDELTPLPTNYHSNSTVEKNNTFSQRVVQLTSDGAKHTEKFVQKLMSYQNSLPDTNANVIFPSENIHAYSSRLLRNLEEYEDKINIRASITPTSIENSEENITFQLINRKKTDDLHENITEVRMSNTSNSESNFVAEKVRPNEGKNRADINLNSLPFLYNIKTNNQENNDFNGYILSDSQRPSSERQPSVPNSRRPSDEIQQLSSNNRRQYNNTIYPTKSTIKHIFGEKSSTVIPESLLLQYAVDNYDAENCHMDDSLLQRLMDDKKKKYDKSLRRKTSFTTFYNNNNCPELTSQFKRDITKIEEALNESTISNSSFRKNNDDMASEKNQKHEWISNYGNINSPRHLNTTTPLLKISQNNQIQEMESGQRAECLRTVGEAHLIQLTQQVASLLGKKNEFGQRAEVRDKSPEKNEETQSDSQHRIRASSLLYFKNLTSQSHNTEPDPQNMINYLSQEKNRIDSLNLSKFHVPETKYSPCHEVSVISPYSERKTVSENILDNLKIVNDSDDSNGSNKSFDMVSKTKYVIKNNKLSPKNTDDISSSIHFPISHYEEFHPKANLDMNSKKKGYFSD